MRSQFLIDPGVVFLNHGSFGACPIPVFETYQRWQLELERQPVEFLGRRVDGLLDEARAVLAKYLNAAPENLVFVPNATSGVNVAARSLALTPGDEILTTDHEYGACSYAWQHNCERTGAKYVVRPLPLPLTTPAAFVEHFWAGVNPRTRVIYLSHITSPTALIFPVEEICRRAREAGIITVIDGAHAPGQIPLDMEQIGADFYTGNCHKWMCTPKGTGFLYVRPEFQTPIEPLIVSWGWTDDADFVIRNQKQGTRDPAAYLTVPAGIAYLQAHDWDTVRARCHALGVELRDQIADWSDQPQIAPESWFGQMFTAPLPPCDPLVVKQRLYDEHKIEVPIVVFNNRQYVRVSFQAYNTREDGQKLLSALQEIIT
ncbi:MAG: aminotransferase class V-fold PLP-dependent enzyme [Chloroflexota bacterium]